MRLSEGIVAFYDFHLLDGRITSLMNLWCCLAINGVLYDAEINTRMCFFRVLQSQWADLELWSNRIPEGDVAGEPRTRPLAIFTCVRAVVPL
jgi:hypothetical protein